jgi:hypothetical protein
MQNHSKDNNLWLKNTDSVLVYMEYIRVIPEFGESLTIKTEPGDQKSLYRSYFTS